MNIHITEIIKNGSKFVQMPFEDYKMLIDTLEDAEDIEAVRAAKISNQRTYPAEVVFKTLEGKSPILAYREYFGLTQQQLADKIGISRVMISDIESGKKSGSIKTIKQIAKIFDVDVDMLIN
jgi:DNA-binding XRE family transcriptional regulator